MRILVYGLSSQLGGVESFFINYYRAMRENCLNIVCDTIGVPGCALKNEIELYNGKVFEIDGDYKEYVDKFFLYNSSNYDVLWANMVDVSDIEVIKAAKKYGMRVIVHSHSSSIMVSGLYGKYRKLRHLYYREHLNKYVDAFWACSDLAAKWMFPSNVLKKHSEVIIPNAIDAKKYRYSAQKRYELRKKYNIDNKIALGYIGRFSFEKNPLFAVQIFEKIRKINENTVMFMFGDGSMREHVEKYIVDNQIEGIYLLGVCHDINAKMQMLDGIILPSLFEGMPMVALEAQAAGLYVFASSDGVSKHTKIVPEFDFIKLSYGPEKWAEVILSTDFQRRDTYKEIVDAGFELSSASINLFNKFTELIYTER